MPSTCPKCHQVLEHDEICCAQLRYSWKCKSCHKLSTGFAFPYGKCFLCGGDLEDVTDRAIPNPLSFQAIRDALQFELNAYHFYRMALDRTSDHEERVILDFMAQNELDHLHELEQKYHAHLDPAVLTLSPKVEELLADRMFAGIDFSGQSGLLRLYERAIEMERRTRAYFLDAAQNAPPGIQRDLYLELAAEEDEHIALLETEMHHLTAEIHGEGDVRATKRPL
jgi:rubrerythrin